VFLWGPFPSHLFFLQEPLDDDVQHINALPKLGDVQVSFKILTHCFVGGLITFFVISSIPIFQHQLASFDRPSFVYLGNS
jgi:hypothetical protein